MFSLHSLGKLIHFVISFFQTACGCGSGANGTSCNSSGVCTCQNDFTPPKCTDCPNGQYGSTCQSKTRLFGLFLVGKRTYLKGAFLLDCSCGVGATSISCDSTGTCNCQTGYATPNCSTCSSGYFGANCSGFFFLFLSLRFVFGCVPKKNLTINRSLWMWHWDSELQLQQYRGMYMQ